MMSRNSQGKNLIVILLQLQVTVLIVSGALIGTNGQRKSGACFHNGTYYYEQSFVPSIEPCLNCRCLESNLVCSLKVCPELPVPPPRGCVVTKKPMTCCHFLSCTRKDVHIPKKRLISYLDRFDKESIDRIINLNFHHRRSDDAEESSDDICIKNGTVYKSGSAMMSSGLCTYCYCIGGQQKCVKPKCILPIYEFGCKPIFVDSTCCPVRYDCNTKSIGKSNIPGDIFKKTTNKHYERMSQRLERNRGCTVGDRYYSEGQKMPRESNKPCDICFCIRGRRKCTPKKCSPPLRNCIPIVPKGQCCPSSYECGDPKELSRFTRSHQSRQFDLYSLIFGNEQENSESSQNNIKPSTEATEFIMDTNQEKGFIDSIREGLQFIDKNGQNVEQILDKSILTTKIPITSTHETIASTEIVDVKNDINLKNNDNNIGFLDILLSTKTPRPETSTKANTIDDDDDDEDISWFDLLLGEDKNGTAVVNATDEVSNKTDSYQASISSKIDSSLKINNSIHFTTTTTITPTTFGSKKPTKPSAKLSSTDKPINANEEIKATKSTHKIVPTTSTVSSTEKKYPETNIYEIIDKRTRPVQLERVGTTSSSTSKPILMKTNPSILDSDFILDYVDPTLPPSLPNLDMIQFMPGDAVKTTKYPAITEKNIVVDPKLPNYQDYTADYEDYPPEPQIQHSGFSPPTETEGGFIPKEPSQKYVPTEKSSVILISEGSTIRPSATSPVDTDRPESPAKESSTRPHQLLAPFNSLPTIFLMKPNENNDALNREDTNNLVPPFMKQENTLKDLIEPLAEIQTDNDALIREDTNNIIPPFMKISVNDMKQENTLKDLIEPLAEIQTKSPQSIATGALKLSGCNIYGRMYRVGRIISELSGPCLECKCTESGVDCKPLDCLDVKKLD